MPKRGNGEGSVYKRKDGRWVGQYLVYTAAGPKYRHLYGKTRADVSKKLTKAMADRDGGIVYDAGTMSVEAYLNRWLKDSVRGTVRVSTVERHEINVRVHIVPTLGRVKLKALAPANARGLHREKLDAGLAPHRPQDSLDTPQGARTGRGGRVAASQRRRRKGASPGPRRDAPVLRGRGPALPRSG